MLLEDSMVGRFGNSGSTDLLKYYENISICFTSQTWWTSFLQNDVVFRFHNPLNTMKVTPPHQQECTVHSLYFTLITLNLVPSMTDPFWRKEKEIHVPDPLTRFPTDSLFKTLIGRRILILGTMGQSMLGARMLELWLKVRENRLSCFLQGNSIPSQRGSESITFCT